MSDSQKVSTRRINSVGRDENSDFPWDLLTDPVKLRKLHSSFRWTFPVVKESWTATLRGDPGSLS